jgi:NodT family efflux transporter outer membrane factor (OMF) lipoprotein
MNRFKIKISFWAITVISVVYTACTVPPSMIPRTEKREMPSSFRGSSDTTSTAKVKWRDFFTDPHLTSLIETALQNNQELNIIRQEINIAQNEVRARKGEYLPFVDLMAGGGVERVARYTRDGSVEKNSQIEPGKDFPEPLPNYALAANLSWQVDIWKRLRNARKAALMRYFATTEGRNFTVTRLIAEIANSYYELVALDNQLEILKQNIQIQTDALEIVRQEKQAARTTELAVRRFEAEVLKNQSRIFHLQQEITQTENRINFLVGRYPQPIARNSTGFSNLVTKLMKEGIPSQLLQNRPDVRGAEWNLAAAKLDVTVAKANFYPQLNISAALGVQAYNFSLIGRPESVLYSIGGGLAQPLINRNAIKAVFFSANARQVQAVYSYEQTVLRAYIEVANQLANINNMQNSYELRKRQVEALTESIDISTRLFRFARADYMEVLLTQRDALESKFELIETKKQQMTAMVNVYQALGGGWN